jgi:xanthine/CO dehydrogenase XdhC/CoxF family maturation factor
VSAQSEFARVAAADGRAALVTVVAGGELGAKLLVRADGAREGSLGGAELNLAGGEAAERLMWAERSELVEHGDVSLSST